MSVKKHHNSNYINGLQVLRYSFHNLKGDIIKIYKVDIEEIFYMYKGEKIPITDYQIVNGNRNQLSIFFSASELFGKRNSGVVRLTIKYKYRNNDKLFTFTDTLKYVNDSQLKDWRERQSKRLYPNKGKGGKKRNRKKNLSTKEKTCKIGII